MQYVVSIDQGTTSTRCIIFNHGGEIVAVDQREHDQIYPQPGWVEHDPLQIWSRTQSVIAGAMAKAERGRARHRGRRHHQPARDHGGLGQGHRQADPQRHRLAGHAHRRDLRQAGAQMAGSIASKRQSGCRWRPTSPAPRSHGCSTTSRARARAPSKGELLVRHHRQLADLEPDRPRHVTDVTNASRTMLMNLKHPGLGRRHARRRLGVPRAMLPEIRSSSEVYGEAQLDRAARRAGGRRSWAINRRRCSARRALRRAKPRTPTAPAASCCSIPARSRLSSKNGLLTTLGYKIGDCAAGVCARRVDRHRRRAGAVAARQSGPDREVVRISRRWRTP